MYLVVSQLVGKVVSMKVERTVMLNTVKAISISNLRDDWMVSWCLAQVHLCPSKLGFDYLTTLFPAVKCTR